ncbi:SHOCT domain-containing protein [Cellulomonas sp. JH27-2]|uniref:SHOCT domain-containing protein n=1 Tax=Cellulomonas sp. JH27-2 TaxID=2774139 RepID=UPI00177FEBB6|nr:SHOCT domain-containing protein [Cellulomonas sp. JH27-2]MBD8059211.1 SHOCT domain-containing protein [Cellulomonas sp. JH27-2]
MDPFTAVPAFMAVMFAVFGVFFVAVVVLIVVSTRRKSRVLRDAGMDPLAADAQMMVAARDSRWMAPEPAVKTIEQRLAEIDDLERRGVIDRAERSAARARVLGEA